MLPSAATQAYDSTTSEKINDPFSSYTSIALLQRKLMLPALATHQREVAFLIEKHKTQVHQKQPMVSSILHITPATTASCSDVTVLTSLCYQINKYFKNYIAGETFLTYINAFLCFLSFLACITVIEVLMPWRAYQRHRRQKAILLQSRIDTTGQTRGWIWPSQAGPLQANTINSIYPSYARPSTYSMTPSF